MKYKITIFALLSGMSMIAQTLSEEVVIDREIVPVVRNTRRPDWVSPSLLAPRIVASPLSFSEYSQTAELTRTITPLEPVQWADSVMRSPYRGYASLGYFPAFNLGAAAGYRFLDTNNAKAGIHLSYDGASWNGVKGSEGKNKRNHITFGADADLRFDPGTFKIALDYTFSNTGMAYFPGGYDRGSQSINIVDLGAKWTPAKTDLIEWDVAANFGYGGFVSNKTDQLAKFDRIDYAPVKDLLFGAKTNLGLKLAEQSAVCVGVGLDFRHSNSFNALVPSPFFNAENEVVATESEMYGAKTMCIISLTPAFRFGANNINGHLGVRVDFNTGGLQKDVHVAPEVKIDWAAASLFAVRLTATGGEVMNSNASLWHRDPWMTGVFAFERSHINADIDLALTYGSYDGFWATVHGGWASVSNWLCPVVIQGVNTWQHRDGFNGFDYGLELGYSWKKYVTVVAHADGAQHGKYYRWQDNAAWVFDAAVKVRPFDKLQIELGYASRVKRRGFVLETRPGVGNNAYYTPYDVNLRNTSNLFLGAEYEITPAVSAFIKAENLLNKHWDLTTNVRSQGVRGLLGAQLKF